MVVTILPNRFYRENERTIDRLIGHYGESLMNPFNESISLLSQTSRSFPKPDLSWPGFLLEALQRVRDDVPPGRHARLTAGCGGCRLRLQTVRRETIHTKESILEAGYMLELSHRSRILASPYMVLMADGSRGACVWQPFLSFAHNLHRLMKTTSTKQKKSAPNPGGKFHWRSLFSCFSTRNFSMSSYSRAPPYTIYKVTLA